MERIKDVDFLNALAKNSKMLGLEDEHRRILIELNSDYDPNSEEVTSSIIPAIIRELEEKINTKTITGKHLKELFYTSKKTEYVKALLKVFREVAYQTFDNQIKLENHNSVSPLDIFLIMYSVKNLRKNRDEIFKLDREDELTDNIFDKANLDLSNMFEDDNGEQFQYFVRKLGEDNLTFFQKKDIDIQNFFYM